MKDRVINDSVNRITQGYSSSHRGVDLGWRSDESQNRVFPNCAGTVYATLDNIPNGSEAGGGWGNYVLIRHDNGMFSRYAHLRSGLPVKTGQRVSETTQIGIIGDSGRAYGRHLHFEVSTSSSSADRINPTKYLTEPISGSTPTPTPSGNERIRGIQQTLNARYNTGLVTDGIYGPATHKAMVKGLQTELNKQCGARLVIDGIFGSATKSACPNLKVGMSGNITWLVQAMLYIKGYSLSIDGIYGSDTRNKVIAFQKANGLSADGICGKNTFEKLFK